MRRPQIALLVAVMFLGLIAVRVGAAPSKFGSEFLGAGEKSTGDKSVAPAGPGRRVLPGARLDVANPEEDPKKLTITIKSLATLLRATKDPAGQDVLLLNRARAAYQLGRLRLLRSKNMKLDSFGNKLLATSLRDAEIVLKRKNQSPLFKAQAHNIRGLSFVYLNQLEKASWEFRTSLAINPTAENAGWIALFVAESFFDSGKYKLALDYYINYRERMNPQEREIALFKTGWTYLNLNQPDQARKCFLDLVISTQDKAIRSDSMRDLAFIVTAYQTPRDIFDVADRILEKKDDKIDFLLKVANALENRGAAELHSKVLVRLEAIMEKDDDRLVEVLLGNLRASRRQFASQAHMRSFIRLRDFLARRDIDLGKDSWEKVRDGYGKEIQALLKSWIDTYAARTQTPEKLSKKDLLMGLLEVFPAFEIYFKESPQRPSVVSLWLELCVDSQVHTCTDDVADRILKEPNTFPKLQEEASLRQLAALEVLTKKDSGKKLKDKYYERMGRYVDRFPNSPSWLEVARRRAMQLWDNQKKGDSIELWDRVSQRSKDERDLYNLQWARFQAAEYEDVLGEERAEASRDPRQRELRREAHLKLAQAARADKKGEAYVEHLKGFLALGPEADRAKMARQDYLSFLKANENYGELTAELGSFLRDYQEEAPKLGTYQEDAWIYQMKKGDFASAKVFARTPLQRSLVTLASGADPLPMAAMLKGLDESTRAYVLSLAVLSQPEAVLDYLNSGAKVRSLDRDLALLALRLQAGSWEIERTPTSLKWFPEGDEAYKKAKRKSSRAQPTIEGLTWPERTDAEAIYNEKLGKVLGELRRLRKDISKELPELELRQAQTLTKVGQDAEKRAAELIRKSPVPEALGEKELSNYKAEIAKLEGEFVENAAEYGKLLASYTERIAQEEAKEIGQPGMARWKWPSCFRKDSCGAAKKQIDSEKLLPALIVIDLLRDEGTLKGEDYFRARIGALLTLQDNSALRRYLALELEREGQKRIVKDWRGLL